MLISPLTKNALKSHEAISDGLKPPRVPMARTMATGPEAAKVNATTALAPWKPLKSETTWRSDGGRAAGRSRGMAMRAGRPPPRSRPSCPESRAR